MVDFLENNNEEISPFEQYYFSDIVPAVEANNRLKEKYRSRFWGFFWTILFLMCVNLLFSLFNFLFNKHPMNYEQMILLNVVAFAFIFLPIRQYRKCKKQDVFGTFVNFYGNWRHLKDVKVPLIHSPIVPPHDFVHAEHNLAAEYPGWSLEMRDTVYKKSGMIKKIRYKSKVSSGIMLVVKLNKNFKGKLYLFEKRGFYRKNKFQDIPNVGNLIAPPLAECFYIFAEDSMFAEDMLPSLFFERIFDLKEAFGAKHLYVEMSGNILRIYLEGAQLYIDCDKFWSRKINKDKFIQLNGAIEQTLVFIETINALLEKHDRH